MEKLLTHPPSPKQVQANQRNAQKSTGPVTEAGKHNVAQAALKHGLYCPGVVIAALGEKQEDYDALRESLLEAWQPDDGQQASLVEDITAQTWLQRRAISSQAQVVEHEVAKVDDNSRDQDLAQQRVQLNEKNADVREWGVRRLPDSHAKFLYWRRLLRVARGLAEHGEFGSGFQQRWQQIYGQYPTETEEFVFWNAHSLGRKHEPNDPNDPPPDPNVAVEIRAELKKSVEEVDREYELYQRRQAQLQGAKRGACGVPDDPRFVLAQRIQESKARIIRQTIELLIKLKRLKAELARPQEGSAARGPVNPSAGERGPTGSEGEAMRTNRDSAGSGTNHESEPAIPKALPGPNEDESHHLLENTAPASAHDR